MSERNQPAAAEGRGEMPFWVLAALAVAAGLVMLGGVLGSLYAFVGAISVVLTDGVMAGLILLAAGGYGSLLFRLLGPRGTPRLLALATSAACGMMLLAMAMLTVGSLIPGALRGQVWWPVLAGGIVLAMVQAHRALGAARLPATVSGASLVWVVLAAAGGLCLAGAVMPPGWLGNLTMDSYDILEYHLQLPREYYQAGQVGTLAHNVYSHYPLGAEMLFLLAMCLRGGAYEGVYLAQMLNGIFALIMVLGVFGALGGTGREEGQGADAKGATAPAVLRPAAAVLLLGTAPWVIYLSWLAMEEMAEMCYLALALLWLGRWLRRRTLRTAGWVGALAGCACATKYLGVGFVAGPVLAVMLAAALRRPARLGHLALAGAVTLAVFSPWLVRNLASAGNPVFPLATDIFGKGYWSEESAQRWRAGHAPGFHPPVPAPPDYQPPPPGASRRQRFAALWMGVSPYAAQPALGQVTVLLLAGTVLGMLIRPRGAGRWDWALAAVLAMQLAVWAAATHEMPARFLAVAVAPMALLISGGLERLAGVPEAPILRQSPAAGGHWGLAPAVLLAVATAALQLGSAGLYYRAEMAPYRQRGADFHPPAGVPAGEYAGLFRNYASAAALDGGGRLMLVGDSAAFYYPDRTVCATVFDRHPLQDILRESSSPPAVAEALAKLGVTHVLVTWPEIRRLEYTYGWPAEMRPDRLESVMGKWPVVDEYFFPMTTSGPAPGAKRVFTLYARPL